MYRYPFASYLNELQFWVREIWAARLSWNNTIPSGTFDTGRQRSSLCCLVRPAYWLFRWVCTCRPGVTLRVQIVPSFNIGRQPISSPATSSWSSGSSVLRARENSSVALIRMTTQVSCLPARATSRLSTLPRLPLTPRAHADTGVLDD